MKRFILCGIGLTLIMGFSPGSPSANEIVNDYIEAIGGKENWLSLKSMERTGTTVTKVDFGYQEVIVNASTHVYKKAPNKVRSESITHDPVMKVQMGYNGTEGWRRMTGIGGDWLDTKPLEGAELDQMKSSTIADPLLRYAENGSSLTYERLEVYEGQECHVVKEHQASGLIIEHYFDAKSKMRLQMVAYGKDNEGKETTLTTKYGDYREVGEFKVPFTSSVEGISTHTKNEVSSYKFNHTLSDALFEMP